jgi:TonB family protein
VLSNIQPFSEETLMKTIPLVLLPILLAGCATASGGSTTTAEDMLEIVAECEAATPLPEGVEPPRILRSPQPDSPTVGPQRGYACFAVTIDVEGRVSDPTMISSSGAEFARSAARKLANWRFEPATKDGAPIEVRYPITVDYLREAAVYTPGPY